MLISRKIICLVFIDAFTRLSLDQVVDLNCSLRMKARRYRNFGMKILRLLNIWAWIRSSINCRLSERMTHAWLKWNVSMTWRRRPIERCSGWVLARIQYNSKALIFFITLILWNIRAVISWCYYLALKSALCLKILVQNFWIDLLIQHLFRRNKNWCRAKKFLLLIYQVYFQIRERLCWNFILDWLVSWLKLRMLRPTSKWYSVWFLGLRISFLNIF